MALSGTLDTFALPDVLRLLASTHKTGRLRVSGSRGSGSVWVVDGEVVTSELSSINSLDPSAVDVVFGLLRFDAGSFTFEADAAAPEAGLGMAMDPILSSAEHMLEDWQAIEAVVPSLDVWVGLLPELDGPDVMVDAARWRCIATIGPGAQVGLIAETLGLNEVEACRTVKDLIELGLVALIDEPMEAPTGPSSMTVAAPVAVEEIVEAPADPPAVVNTVPDAEPLLNTELLLNTEPPHDVATTESPSFDASPAPFIDEPVSFETASPVGPATELSSAFASEALPGASTVPNLASLASSEDLSFDEASAPAEPEPVEDLNPAEMARQLANLSPKAAKAVAAAAKANTEAERDAALAAVEAEDGSVNRGLLLKFLGSVDS